MEGQIFLNGIPMTAFMESLRLIIREEIKADLKEQLNEKLLSPKQTAIFLGVSLVTLNAWEKQGKISAHRLGGRVYYKQSELIASLSALKKYKRTL